jgi:hypothetical protein
MDYNFEEEEQKFLEELKGKTFSIEIIPNTGISSREQEEQDIAAYKEYLKSKDFDSFYNGAFK